MRKNLKNLKWYSVKDKPPPEEGIIIFYTPDLRNPTDTMIGICRQGRFYSAGDEFFNITYWMHVPNPPTK